MVEVIKKMMVQEGKRFLQVVYGDIFTGREVQWLQKARMTKVNMRRKRRPQREATSRYFFL